MKVTLAYPKIPDSKGFVPKNFIAFEKYDGTNLHWVWQGKWRAFGTRRDRFSLDDDGIYNFNLAHPGLEESSTIFFRNYAKPLNDLFVKNYDASQIIVFTEFYGEHSFAGIHDSNDDKKLSIIDIKVNDLIIPPNTLVRVYSHSFDVARVVYSGKFTGQFVEDVRNGKFKVNEGVVCKGIHKNILYMCKIKTNAYMEKLKTEFKNNWKDYWE